ncbi:MAG: GNAT family N-acetyltransferase [Caldilineaceae bacterium]|nr:GNAT family N-acetyltransferase [Caldilineaceae bacterium]
MSTYIARERPDTTNAKLLIQELEAYLGPLYPAESHHGFSVEKLLRENVPFFLIWHKGLPAGCGAIKFFGTDYGELKRMYVRPAFRGLGLAKLLLDFLADYARSQRVPILRLETGIHQPEAIGLYERWGFAKIAPFGDYQEDPLSLFYEKRID